MAAVSEETLSIEAQAERPFSEAKRSSTPFKRGDVLVANGHPVSVVCGKMAQPTIRSFWAGSGPRSFTSFSQAVGEDLLGTLCCSTSCAHRTCAKQERLRSGAAGQRRVPADFFAALQIPLPPLDEQKRIAGILDAADALRAKRREALAELDTLLQSTFLDMFGDPVTNPMGWEERHLDRSSVQTKAFTKARPIRWST